MNLLYTCAGDAFSHFFPSSTLERREICLSVAVLSVLPSRGREGGAWNRKTQFPQMGKKVMYVLGWHPKLCPGALSGRTPWWNILVSFPGSGKMVSFHFQEAEIQAVSSNFFLVVTHTAPCGVWIPHQVLPMTSRRCFPAGHGYIWAFFRSNSKSAALPKAKGAMGVCSLLPESLPVLRQLPGTNLPQGGALGTESSSWFADTLGGSDGKESACSVGDPLVRRVPRRREWQPTTVFLPGEFHGQRSLVDYSPRRSQELDTTEWLTLFISTFLV